MYRFRISSSSDRTALASGFPSCSNRRHRLCQLVAMAVRDDRCWLEELKKKVKVIGFGSSSNDADKEASSEEETNLGDNSSASSGPEVADEEEAGLGDCSGASSSSSLAGLDDPKKT
nr:hypothetical protein CFP56_55066 [Quercus suber]